MPERTVNEKNRLQIFNALIKEPNPFGPFDEYNGLLDFLQEIWNLREMPSEDSRFGNALEDVAQHTINNDDWEDSFLFLERLKLLEDNEIYIKFLETVVNPDFRKSEDEVIKFVLLINPYLGKDGLELYLSHYDDDGRPVYLIQQKAREDSSIYIKKNDIPFFVDKNTGYSYDKANAHRKPTEYPSFVLAHNAGWNDYGYFSLYHLYYYVDAQKYPLSIGGIRIIHESDMETSMLPDRFEVLDDGFCSLGQNIGYYETLKAQMGRDFESVLYALRDSAFFHDILERFEKKDAFRKSLTRIDRAERLLREARHKVFGFDLSNLYSFDYTFQPVFSKSAIDINFSFSNDDDFPNRVYALIGKNGAGKTQLITSLPKDISRKKDENFSPRTPFFSKVITVSYSVFDNFEIPKKTASFNYIYCGIRNDKGEMSTERGLLLRFHNSWKRIVELQRVEQWRSVLLNFIERELVDEFLVLDTENTSSSNRYKVDISDFGGTRKKLSSGQSIILYIISEIVANIRYDSLLLFDEPETHLHPNAITQLVNTIYSLVGEFESYCIITTHSPLIIREMFSKNVYVMEKHDNVPSVRRIGIESFGEDSSVLTEEVFGNKEIPKHYKTKIRRLVEQGYGYDDILSKIEFDELPLSLNAKIYIKSLLKNTNA